MKRILSYLSLAFIMATSPLVITCCAPSSKPPTPVVQVVNPTVQADVRPALTAIVASNHTLQNTVAVQATTITEQKYTIEETIKTYEELKKQLEQYKPLQVITTKLTDQLNSVKARNLFIETQNVTLKTSLDEQIKLTDEAIEKALAKDEESRAWQRVIVTKDDIIAKVANERDLASKERDKFKTEANKASVYKFWVITLAVSFIAWTVAKNLLMMYFPAVRFRV